MGTDICIPNGGFLMKIWIIGISDAEGFSIEYACKSRKTATKRFDELKKELSDQWLDIASMEEERAEKSTDHELKETHLSNAKQYREYVKNILNLQFGDRSTYVESLQYRDKPTWIEIELED